MGQGKERQRVMRELFLSEESPDGNASPSVRNDKTMGCVHSMHAQ